MLMISTFEHTLQVEQALAVLEKSGIDKGSFLIVPMDQYEEKPMSQLLVRAEGIKVKPFELGMVLATGFSVIGASMGFKLKWGPIVWGLTYAAIGLLIGVCLVCVYNLFRGKQKTARSPKRPFPELALIVQCRESKLNEVRQVLWQYHAISVGEAMEPGLQE